MVAAEAPPAVDGNVPTAHRAQHEEAAAAVEALTTAFAEASAAVQRGGEGGGAGREGGGADPMTKCAERLQCVAACLQVT